MTATRKWSAGAALVAVLVLAAGWFLLVSPEAGRGGRPARRRSQTEQQATASPAHPAADAQGPGQGPARAAGAAHRDRDAAAGQPGAAGADPPAHRGGGQDRHDAGLARPRRRRRSPRPPPRRPSSPPRADAAAPAEAPRCRPRPPRRHRTLAAIPLDLRSSTAATSTSRRSSPSWRSLSRAFQVTGFTITPGEPPAPTAVAGAHRQRLHRAPAVALQGRVFLTPGTAVLRPPARRPPATLPPRPPPPPRDAPPASPSTVRRRPRPPPRRARSTSHERAALRPRPGRPRGRRAHGHQARPAASAGRVWRPSGCWASSSSVAAVARPRTIVAGRRPGP